MQRGYVYIILCFLFLGIGTPVSKDAVYTLPPWLFMIMTLAIGAMLMAAVAAIREHPSRRLLTLRNTGGILAQALLGAVLYTVFILYGLTYTSTVTAGIVTSITPAVTLLLSVAFLREALTARKLAAIAAAVTGVGLVSVIGVDAGGATSTLPGVIFMLLSVVSISTFFVVAKHLSVDLPPATMTAALLVAALLLSLPFGLREAAAFDWATMTPLLWGETVFYGLAVWALPFFFTYLGIRTVPASAVGMATAVTPVAAILTAVLLFGETLRIVDLAALALVILSIFVAETGSAAPADDALTA